MLTVYFHHVLLTFPIALLVNAAALLVLSWFVWGDSLRKAGGVALVLGTLMGVLAAATGFFGHEAAEARGVDERALDAHGALAFVGLATAMASSLLWLAGIRARRSHAALFCRGVPVLTVVAAAVTGWAAHRGTVMLHPRPASERPAARAGEEVSQAPCAAVHAATDAQLDRGQRAYARHCAECHGDRGQGTFLVPGLIGSRALPLQRRRRATEFRSAMDLLDFIAKNMPEDDPGALSPATYRDIAAYLLDQNGIAIPLTAEVARGIDINPRRTATARPRP